MSMQTWQCQNGHCPILALPEACSKYRPPAVHLSTAALGSQEGLKSHEREPAASNGAMHPPSWRLDTDAVASTGSWLPAAAHHAPDKLSGSEVAGDWVCRL